MKPGAGTSSAILGRIPRKRSKYVELLLHSSFLVRCHVRPRMTGVDILLAYTPSFRTVAECVSVAHMIGIRLGP